MQLVKQCWYYLTIRRQQVRIGVIYGPREFKGLYESISDKVDIGKEKNQQIIILADFNAKIRNCIKNNKKTITK